MEKGQLFLKIIKTLYPASYHDFNGACCLLRSKVWELCLNLFLSCHLIEFHFTAGLGSVQNLFSRGSVFDHNTLLR